MRQHKVFNVISVLALLFFLGVMPAWAEFSVQCPPDLDGIDTDGDGDPDNDHVCVHLSSGDGYVKMADDRDSYIFGFASHRNSNDSNTDPVVFRPGDARPPAVNIGLPTSEGGLTLGATFPAPTIEVREGQKLYLTLSNVGMLVRPDLFDPHTVHYHGFPNVASIFDGLPDSAIAINMGFSLTYFYNLVEPGTFMYHCHVEATEHMQMGMLGNIYVQPRQNIEGNVYDYPAYAYNDGDGSTGYYDDKALQIHSFDPDFHDANELVQPLPFAYMHDRYPMFNGRGYPETVNPGNIANKENYEAQLMDSIIEVPQGERFLLRLSSLSTVDFYTIASPSIPMTVVGQGARILRTAGDPAGAHDLYYTTHSVTLGGGDAKDIILDTTGIPTGTYFIYTSNLNNLSNDQEDFGGMMTEIVVQAPLPL